MDQRQKAEKGEGNACDSRPIKRQRVLISMRVIINWMQGNESGEEERGGEWWYSSRVELEWPAGVGVAESSATDKHVQDGKKGVKPE